MIPKCSFRLKPKIRIIPEKHIPKVLTHSLGEYIRNERLKRDIKQEVVADKLKVHSVALSNWEHNKKSPHPKHFDSIIDFLGFVPKKQSRFDKLGTRTQLWRLQNNITLEEFSSVLNTPIEIIVKIEEARHCKLEDEIKRRISAFIQIPISCEVPS